jgi:biopolymer transport protein TolR
MGGSVDEGKGRGKGLNFELNLVPFIDLLSVNIVFLIPTAVWTQNFTMQVDQAIQDPNAPPPPPDPNPPPPPMTVHIRADGVWAGRKVEEGKNYPKIEDKYDWNALATDLATDRSTYPAEEQVIIVTDDGVEYEHMIAALDLTRGQGYEKTLLGGGPAQAAPLTPTPTP